LVLRQRRWHFWTRSLAELPVLESIYASGQIQTCEITDIPLEPISAPREVTLQVMSTLELTITSAIPSQIDAWLELDMVGPTRLVKKHIHTWQRPRLLESPGELSKRPAIWMSIR
jgi:hypothetical protein